MKKKKIIGNQFRKSDDNSLKQKINSENENSSVGDNDAAIDSYALLGSDDEIFQYDENLDANYNDYMEYDNEEVRNVENLQQAENLAQMEQYSMQVEQANDGANNSLADISSNEMVAKTEQSLAEIDDEDRPIKVKTIAIQSQNSKVNHFDLFFLKLWASIVAGIGYCAEGVNYVFNLLFKRKLPLKYVKAFISALIILLLLILIILPFAGTGTSKSKDDGLTIFESNMAPVKIIVAKDDNGFPIYKWGYVDKNKAPDELAANALKIPAIYEEALPFNKYGIAWARMKNEKEDYWELINTKGKRVGKRVYFVSNSLSPNERPVGDFTDSKLCWVNEGSKFGYIDIKGNVKINSTYDVAGDFVDGIARVGRGDKYWFINTREKQISKYVEYEDALDFSCGLGAVKRGKWGFINKKGDEVISLQYDAVSQFVDDYAMVKMGKTFGIINNKGERIIGTLEYNEIYIDNPIFKEFVEKYKD